MALHSIKSSQNDDLFDKSVISDLNVNESRVSPAFIVFVGKLVVSFLNTFYGSFRK